MTTAPILSAESMLVSAIKTALTPFVGTYNTRAKVYYRRAEQSAPPPFLIFQMQSDINRLDRIGDVGSEVDVTIKALASSGSAARTLLETASPGMDALAAPAGYTITARYDRSPTLPPSDDGMYQALHVYRVRIERA